MGMAVRNANLASAKNGLTGEHNGNPETANDELARKYNLKLNPTTGLYDCNGNVKVGKDLVKDGRLVIGFGTVKGNFDCHLCDLTSLEGAPQKVGGNFYCTNNNSLTSLEGAPQKVGKDFDCSLNKLTSLEGAPQEVGGSFDCSFNNLTTIKGAPQKVGGNFECNNNNLIYNETKFYGFLPDVIKGNLKADNGCNYELARTYYNKN